MKKGLVAVIMVGLLSLSGCLAPKTFNGSSTGNEDQFITSYSVLNTTLSNELELEAGDIVDVSVENNCGQLEIHLEEPGGHKMLREKFLTTSESFPVEISKSGKYRVSVIGENAKGEVSIVKQS
ncbi:hypothetical protein [Enterococcus sp. HY326]|uniref:hypothetical protein n=1 Tax=Enterococcus sp. HY326 TaxID=2971265 RepID=UPI00223F3D7A|nr:hypothetical protein [Enterococcus sp. HY326]